ncbi:TonB-dependent receptor [Rhizomicrobium electricum]|uniref:TonB-dependent receptor n=1 Tax=Rhizomicrobium electricum TaxID=480070 RepID=UPI001420FDF6|nr:TonB-dependent receptor [Rhizomicrobium electricum]NIJ49109.1 TonB-dependent receptor [Rhizomicrobium electricum]
MSRTTNTRGRLLGTTVLASVSFLLSAVPTMAQEALETVTVTGYRASLADSTNAKRAAIGFSDSVFAEDIGKFPDSNIAESLNRIPGVTIVREINGDGMQVQIRGLGTNFTKILVNGNPISVATTGATDGSNTNREVDLNMLPPEMFTQLSVSKSPTADQIEGGAAGSVSMRVLRPFDKPGFHLNYNFKLLDQSTTKFQVGESGSIIVSDSWDKFGVLLGLSGQHANTYVYGFEDGNASWYGPNLPTGTCAASGTTNTCAQFGSKAWTIPSSVQTGVYVPVPSGYTLNTGYAAQVVNGTSYLPTGYPVDQRLLYALNPGLADASCSQTAPSTTCLNQMSTRLSNALLPRLGRPMREGGTRDRYNAALALEFRPTDSIHTYLDVTYGHIDNHMDRSDMGWGVRTGNGSSQMIPQGLTLSSAWLGATSLTGGLGGSVQTGTFYNPTFSIEARDYRENGDFLNLNPGASWQVTDLLKIEAQAYYSNSHFLRRNPTVMVASCTGGPLPASTVPNCNAGFPATGTKLTFDATGAFPTENINIDLNDPNNFQWLTGRVNLNGENRFTTTHGIHFDTTYGGDKFAVKVGAAYDVAYRLIRSYADDARWQAAICGGNPNYLIGGPNSSMPSCNGQASDGTAGWVPPTWLGAGATIATKYPGWGTGYTAGAAPLAFSGSLIPTTKLASYLSTGGNGFISVNYDRLYADSNYYAIQQKAYNDMLCIPNCSWLGKPGTNVTDYHPASLTSRIDERTVGLYGETFGSFDIGDRKLKYNVGLRWIETRQWLQTPGISLVDPRNAGPDGIAGNADDIQDGGKYPNYTPLVAKSVKYHAFLPSASFVYEVSDDFQVRFSASRTMTRPNPGNMSAAVDFGDPTVSTATLGNSALKPYYATNFDIGGELYTGGEGYVSLTMFRKSISGFTAQMTTKHIFADLADYGIIYNSLNATQKQTYANGGTTGVSCNSDATCANQTVYINQQVNLKGLEIINGLEINYVQPLDFLTDPYLGLKGFGFTGNLTIIDQKSTGQVPTYATGVAPWQFNVTGFYEADGVMLRMSYNWNDTSYASTSQSGGICLPAVASGVLPAGCPSGAYLFSKAYGQADFSSSVKLDRFFGELPSDPELTFDVTNVFAAKQRSYVQFPDTVHSYYFKGQNFMLGIRGTF